MAGKKKILIVEDGAEIATMMVFLLSRAGCEARIAQDAGQGLHLARNEDFDLITLDVDLPGMSGFEICRRLKKNPRSSRTPVIFVSGRSFEEDVRHGFELGAVDYIIKPFETKDFAFRVVSHIKTKTLPAQKP